MGTSCKSASIKIQGGLDPTQENHDQPSTPETIPDDKHVEPSFTDDVEMSHLDVRGSCWRLF
jgi:condensin-2 complex subunit H2